MIKKETKISPMPSSPKTEVKPKNMPNINSEKIVPKKMETRVSRLEEKQDNYSKIPVIKNNNLSNQRLESKKVETPKVTMPSKPFPNYKDSQVKSDKSENLFPDIPMKEEQNDSFFDDDEIKDLNKFMESDDKKSWF